ncbi:MAG TPA: Ppx/GppA phosphatase family protein [Anaerolineae bacterium]|nr:Ppx/GppA phosphatase family protein [Anaerolineae bacterium]
MTETSLQHVAIIDLGSNTCRLIVMAAIPGYRYRLEDQIREVVRLRQGMTEQGLSPAARERALATMRLFKRFCAGYGVDTILATATSAVREAPNGPAFVRQVKEETGITLQVLTGEQEAYYGVLGVLNEIPMETGYILDIGGGSAQISEVRNGRFHRGDALTLGALALSERFITNDPITNDEIKTIQTEIDAQLDTLKWVKPRDNYQIAGLGGTIRNLAQMVAARNKTSLWALHGVELSRDDILWCLQTLQEKPLADRQKIAGLNSDRADIILPGILVLLAVMARIDIPHIKISTNGLREGIFLETFWSHLPYPVIGDVRRFSVLNLARNYQYHKNHANHVRFLATRLFRQLVNLHQCDENDLAILDAAAILHDLGTIVAYKGHHKHSQTLIEYNGLPGFDQSEIALIALLTRYHRKGTPQIAPYDALLTKKDSRRLTFLAAILRLAEFLERGRNAAIDDVIAHWDDNTLHLTLVSDLYPAVEIWEAEKHALPLMVDAFEREVLLHSLTAPQPIHNGH